ncbi:cyclic nucleotide-binding protein [Candidatus Pacearchaeota archaeon]|mgnify:CR=1 FL=1|jgi:uncharacterized membrane protein|nr:cyclic nucleotide-binding protein [Candidatus Pacearchaeota archaeon]|tara:strand:+ start:172 stop:684 length:513 start_codon:yes stop_codon:yes gene_type:complete
MKKRGFSKTSKYLQKLSKKIVNTHLDEGGKKVGKATEEIFTTLSRNINPKKKNRTTIGQSTADWLTRWAGSWIFIIGFLIFLVLWMILNTYYWANYLAEEPFDPFPFILLNLVLSCLAAIQAPIILMSQNRSTHRDRIRAEYDYKVNRRAEKEIREIKKQLDRIEKRFIK